MILFLSFLLSAPVSIYIPSVYHYFQPHIYLHLHAYFLYYFPVQAALYPHPHIYTTCNMLLVVQPSLLPQPSHFLYPHVPLLLPLYVPSPFFFFF